MSNYEIIKNTLNSTYKKYFDECKKTNRCPQIFDEDFVDKQLFNYAASLNEGYGDSDSSKKLLVVGLEIAGNRKAQIDKIEIIEKTDPNKHWFWTMLTAIKFYYDINNEEMKELELKGNNEYGKMKEMYNDIVRNKYNFAFTDYLKCGLSNDKNRKQKNVKRFTCMWENCANLLLEEIKILKPDLIILQNIDIFDYLIRISSLNIKIINNQPIYEKDLFKDKGNNIEMKLWKCELHDEKEKITKQFYIIESYFPRSKFLSTNKIDGMQELYNFIDKYKEIS